jgi:hypothetical protein
MYAAPVNTQPFETDGHTYAVTRHILGPAFVTTPRHPWHGEFSVLKRKIGGYEISKHFLNITV